MTHAVEPIRFLGRTAPALLAERGRRHPREVAFRSKDLGLYRERTWSDYCDLVARCALGLTDMGLDRGSRVAIMGDACEEWLICDMAAQAAGAVPFGIHPAATDADLEHQLRDSGAAVFVAETQEHADRVLPLFDRLPALKAVVLVDTAALFALDHPVVVGYDRVLTAGKAGLEAAGASGIEMVERLAGDLDPECPAFLVYAPDATGRARGARIGHGRHLVGARGFLERYPLIGRPGQRTVAHLPPCSILGRQAAVTLPLISGLVPHFGESSEDVSTTLFEVAPTVLFTVPRFLEMLASQILLGITDTSAFKRAVYQGAAAFGRRHARKRWDGSPPFLADAFYRLLHRGALRPILNKIGFDRLELVIAAGAPFPPELMALWHIYGVNVAEVYCPAEASGAPVAAHPGSFPRPGSGMAVAAGWDVALGEEAEILVRGDALFQGYWQGGGEAGPSIDGAGWLHTGDVGECSGGTVRVVDRARDPIVTSSGRAVAAAHIEGLLLESPYVAHAAVVGHGRKHLTALLAIDAGAVGSWARGRGIQEAGEETFPRHPEVLQLLQGEIDRVNARLARFQQIRAFRAVPAVPQAGRPPERGGEAARGWLWERLGELGESLYDGPEERLVERAVGDILR